MSNIKLAEVLVLIVLCSGISACTTITGVEQQDPVEHALQQGFSSGNQDALDHFTNACQLGSTVACNQLGTSFARGINGATQDYEEARKWFQIGAEKGNIAAQINLANLYADLKVVPSNDIEGYKWVLIAELAGGRCREQDIKGNVNPNQVNSMPARQLCTMALQAARKERNKFILRMKEADRQASKQQALKWWNSFIQSQ